MRLLILSALALFTFHLSAQTCPTSDFIITTQQEMDDFGQMYNTCSYFEFDITIDDGDTGDIANLNGLLSANVINGQLSIRNCPALVNLSGLKNIIEIQELILENLGGLDDLSGLNNLKGSPYGYPIQIKNLNGIVDLTGLERLRNTSGITIDGCDNLQNTNGLFNLGPIYGKLTINNNPLLNDLSGFAFAYPASIEITNNPSLSNCNLESFCAPITCGFTSSIIISNNATGCNSISELSCNLSACCPQDLHVNSQAELDLFIQNFPDCKIIQGDVVFNNISDLSPVSNIEQIHGRLAFFNLTDITTTNAMSSLEIVGEDIEFRDNHSIEKIEFPQLIAVQNGFQIINNIGLKSIKSTPAFSETGSLLIINNPDIENIDGLSNLTYIDIGVVIGENPKLSSIDGLSNVMVWGATHDPEIFNNPLLSDCAIESICSHLDNGGSVFASGNKTDCNSQTEIENICNPAPPPTPLKLKTLAHQYNFCPSSEINVTDINVLSGDVIDLDHSVLDPGNGVNNADLLFLNRHITDVLSFTSYHQMLAGDVDSDGDLDQDDLQTIADFNLGIGSISPSWKFVHTSTVINSQTDLSTVYETVDLQNVTAADLCDYIIIKNGDVTGNADPLISHSNTNLVTTYHSQEPQSATDLTNQLTNPVLSQSQTVWAMVGDASSGDFETTSFDVVIEGCEDLTSFITTWTTDIVGTSCNSCITIPTTGGGYNYDVDWNNDGVFEETGINSSVTHDFGTMGTYTIRIRGDFPRIYFNNGGDKLKITSIDQWGDVEWQNMNGAFHGCFSMFHNAIDEPNLSLVKDMGNMLNGAIKFDGDLSSWDVSKITNMNSLFEGCEAFKGDIENWSVDKVINMSRMFRFAKAFNGNLDQWNVSNVTTMNNMFNNALLFNGDVSGWNVENVTNMSVMFKDALAFNQNIGSWNVSKVTDMSFMFNNAESFNQDLNQWDVSNVTTTAGQFANTEIFNGDLISWDVENVTNMNEMFFKAKAFNSNISNWKVSNVTEMKHMFREAIVFNQNINSWDVSSVTTMATMFHLAHDFNQNIGDWDVANVNNLSGMFSTANSFDQDISNWDVSKVVNISHMFSQAKSFNQNLSSWDVENVEFMSNVFNGASVFDSDLSGWDISSVIIMTNMLDGSGLSISNYDKFLASLKNQGIPNLTLGVQNLNYCQGELARTFLINDLGWTISGDNLDCSNVVDIQCVGDIIFTSQEEIDNFFLSSGGCTNIIGNVTIQEGFNNPNFIPIENLEGLFAVKNISGNFSISNNDNLLSFEGLNSLERIENQFTVSNNNSIENFEGFDNLKIVDSWTTIQDNDKLENFLGWESLEHIALAIGGAFIIFRNSNLSSLSGLQNLKSVHSYITLSQNPQLALCNVTGVCDLLNSGKTFYVGGNATGCVSKLEITNNCNDITSSPILLTTQQEVNTFYADYGSQLVNNSKVNQSLHIIEKSNAIPSEHIIDLTPLLGVTGIVEDFVIADTKSLVSLNGLNDIDYVLGSLTITNNLSLVDLSALSINSLESVGHNLTITNNPLLENLIGLDKLKEIGGNLNISSNAVLNNINAIMNLDFIQLDLSITDNPSLGQCTGINHLIESSDMRILGTMTLDNNARGCNSIQEIRASIPTMGQWALLILGLILTSLGLGVMMQKRQMAA